MREENAALQIVRFRRGVVQRESLLDKALRFWIGFLRSHFPPMSLCANGVRQTYISRRIARVVSNCLLEIGNRDGIISGTVVVPVEATFEIGFPGCYRT